MALAELTGNERARTLLLRALGRGALPHALLFHGPRGVGKAAAAQALAEALLCESPTPDACGRCGACWRTAKRAHPDLLYLEREEDAQFIKIEAARELVRRARLKPYEARAKVLLLPEAERLSEESANTLLKTIEEPPAATYIVLVTSSREGVLATVRSRCQALAFRALSRAELVRRIQAASAIGPEEAEIRARMSLGAEQEAIEMDLDERREQRSEAIAALLPLAAGRLDSEDAGALLERCESLARKDDGVEAFLATLRPIGRDALVLAGGGDASLLVNRDAEAALRELASALGVAGAAALLADLERAEGDLRLNANRRLLLEAILLGVYVRARPPRPSR